MMMTMMDAYHSFMRQKEIDGVTPGTLSTYKYTILHVFIEYTGDIELAELDREMVEMFKINVMRSDLSRNTQSSYIRHLKVFLRFLYDRDYIDTDLCKYVKNIKEYKVHYDIYKDNEILMMFTMLGKSERDRRRAALLALLIDTGCRISELLDIKESDIDYRNKSIVIHGEKTHMDRRVPINHATIQFIMKYTQRKVISHDGYILTDLHVGKKMDKRTAQSVISNYLKKKIGIQKANSKLFRHTFATRICMETQNSFHAQMLLGHMDLSTTKRYYQDANSYKHSGYQFESIEFLLTKCYKIMYNR